MQEGDREGVGPVAAEPLRRCTVAETWVRRPRSAGDRERTGHQNREPGAGPKLASQRNAEQRQRLPGGSAALLPTQQQVTVVPALSPSELHQPAVLPNSPRTLLHTQPFITSRLPWIGNRGAALWLGGSGSRDTAVGHRGGSLAWAPSHKGLSRDCSRHGRPHSAKESKLPGGRTGVLCHQGCKSPSPATFSQSMDQPHTAL